jgi:hypothetical protein
MEIVRPTLLPSLGYLDRIEMCLDVEDQDLWLEVLSKDGTKSTEALTHILAAATQVGLQDKNLKVVVTISPSETLDAFHVSPTELCDGLCTVPNATVAFHKGLIPPKLATMLVSSKATIFIDQCFVDYASILQFAGTEDKCRSPIKLVFRGGPGLTLGLNGTEKNLPFPSVTMLIDCMKKAGLESLCFKGCLPLPGEYQEMIGFFKAAKSR